MAYDKLKRSPCATIFKFGSSRFPSHEAIEIPVKLPVKSSQLSPSFSDSFFTTIKTYVVNADVTFLLGDNTMKEWHSKIDVGARILEVHKFKNSKMHH